MTDKEKIELDAWIAEHVMGFTFHESPDRWHVQNSDRIYFVQKDETDDCPANWTPTKDGEHALLVWDKCLDKLYPRSVSMRSFAGGIQIDGVNDTSRNPARGDLPFRSSHPLKISSTSKRKASTRRYLWAARLACVAIGKSKKMYGDPRTNVAEDDPLAWWILTEAIATGGPK